MEDYWNTWVLGTGPGDTIVVVEVGPPMQRRLEARGQLKKTEACARADGGSGGKQETWEDGVGGVGA
jgi:hypothetical protein